MAFCHQNTAHYIHHPLSGRRCNQQATELKPAFYHQTNYNPRGFGDLSSTSMLLPSEIAALFQVPQDQFHLEDAF